MIPATAPASKYNEVVATINEYRANGEFTDFDLQRQKRSANQIKEKVDLSEGCDLLGMIACLEGKVDEMHRNHKIAIQQSGNDTRFIVNYTKSLMDFLLFDEANKIASEAYSRDPLSSSSIEAALMVTCFFNEKEKFFKLLKEWKKITKKDYYLSSLPLNLVADRKHFSEFIRKNPDINDIYRLFVPGLIRSFEPPLTLIAEVIPEPGHEDEVVIWIQWHGSMEEGMDKFDAFEDWFIENDYDLKTDVLSFNIEIVGK